MYSKSLWLRMVDVIIVVQYHIDTYCYSHITQNNIGTP